MKTILFCSLVLVLAVYSAKLQLQLFVSASYLTKCKRGKDSTTCVVDNANAAIQHLFKNGEAKFNLPNLSAVSSSVFELQGGPYLKFLVSDTAFTGFDGEKVLSGQITDTELSTNGIINRFGVTGNYDMIGQILVLPLHGQGRMNITAGVYNLTVNLTFAYKARLLTEDRNGKKYYKVVNNNTVTTTEMKDVYFQFDKLGPEVNKFINDNWREVLGQVKAAIEQTITYELLNPYVNAYLYNIPIEDLVES